MQEASIPISVNGRATEDSSVISESIFAWEINLVDYSVKYKDFYPAVWWCYDHTGWSQYRHRSTPCLLQETTLEGKLQKTQKSNGNGIKVSVYGPKSQVVLDLFQCLHTFKDFCLPRRGMVARFRIYSIVPSSFHLHLCSFCVGSYS